MLHEVRIRPAKEADLNELFHLAIGAGPGMTNFPPDQTILMKKIKWSLESFQKLVETAGQEFYYFVIESLSTNTPVGCCGIFAQAGGEMPFYNYKINHEKLYSKEIALNKTIQLLNLVHDYHACSEIAALYLSPAHRINRYGEFLSRSRFLFIAAHEARFAEKIIAEMRGVIDKNGRSPFWESIGRHFFDLEFTIADRMCSVGNKQFIQDAMPNFPIYTALLPKEAQEVIGKVHHDTRPALNLLQKEGFVYERYLDIFDGGAAVEARREHIYSISESTLRSAELQINTAEKPRGTYMISNDRLDFRAVVGPLWFERNSATVRLAQETIDRLEINIGDNVRYVAFPLTAKRARMVQRD